VASVLPLSITTILSAHVNLSRQRRIFASSFQVRTRGVIEAGDMGFGIWGT